MKKVLVLILCVIFFIGVYMNFGSNNPIDQLSFNTSNDNANEESDQNESNDENGSDTEGGEESTTDSETDSTLVFTQPALNEKYETVSNNNEPLIIDILLPEYYSDDFESRLSAEFDTNTVQFNRQDLNVNSTDLSEISISDNSDAVIIDALQIQDYNDEVLFDRNNNNLVDVYMNIFNSDRVAFILGNPNVHEHENLENVLETNAGFFSDNDYYYIDNQDIETDGAYDYDTNTLSESAEDAMIQNIYNYLTE